MLKNILIVIFVVFSFIGCSDNSKKVENKEINSISENKYKDELFYDLEDLKFEYDTNNKIILEDSGVTVPSFDYFIEEGAKARQFIYLTNRGRTFKNSLYENPSSESERITTSTDCGSTLRFFARCYIKLEFNAQNLISGEIHSETFKINNEEFSFRFNVIEKPEPVLDNSLVSVRKKKINFNDQISDDGGKASLTYNLVNRNRSPIVLNLNTNNLNRIISNTNCPEELASFRICWIKLELPVIKNEETKTVQENISIAGINHTIQGYIKKRTTEEIATEFSSNLYFNKNNIDFDLVNYNDLLKKEDSIIIMNTKRLPLKTLFDTSQINFFNVDITSCPNELPAFSRCRAKITLVPSVLLPPGNLNESFKIGSQIINLSAFIVNPEYVEPSGFIINETEYSTELGSFFPLQIDYREIITRTDLDYENTTYEVLENNLVGEYVCNSPVQCIYTPSSLGDFTLTLKATYNNGVDEIFIEETIINVNVFGSDNVPVFSDPNVLSISLNQGEVLNFDLISATSGQDPVVYELVDYPNSGLLDSCLDAMLSDGNSDLSCRYTANGDFFSTNFYYKAINTVNNKYSVKEVQINILDSDTVLDVFPGSNASLALNDSGFIFGRGLNNSKMFGINSDYADPSFIFEGNNVIKVPLVDKVEKLYVKRDSAIAKLVNGEYYAWGSGLKSRLAIQKTATTGTSYFIYNPVKITEFESKNLDFSHITINDNSSCGITVEGDVWCWGSNQNGELGYEVTTPNYGEYRPAKISFGLDGSGNPRKASKLAVSSVNSTHHCAIVENEAWCWGLNDQGQLGLGKTSSELPSTFLPTKVALGEQIKEIAIGNKSTCAINVSNQLKCWGDNSYGQLGQENTTPVGLTIAEMQNITPVNLGSGLTASKVYFGAGGQSVCSILNDSTVKCWGRNDLGQLGNGFFETIGDEANEMGSNLDVLKDNNGFSIYAAFIRQTGVDDFCLRSNIEQKVFCWGNNTNKAISEIVPYNPAVPTEYTITPGDTAPYLIDNAILSYNFNVIQNTSRGFDDSGFTTFKDIYTPQDQIKYFIDQEGVNTFNGNVYDLNDPSIVAGKLPIECLNGITETELRNCNFTPSAGYIGTFVIKYKACSSNFKCSDDLITMNGRVVDPNKPYFEDNNEIITLNIDRYESASFEASIPKDPQNKYSGIISVNDTVKFLPNNKYAFYDSQGNLAGIISGCSLALSTNVNWSIYGHSAWRNGNCSIKPKANFKGTAIIQYKAVNVDGYESNVRTININVNNDRPNSLSFVGSQNYMNFHNSLTNRVPETYNSGWRSSAYLAAGGQDNSLAPTASYDPYPSNIQGRITENKDNTLYPRYGYNSSSAINIDGKINDFESISFNEEYQNFCSKTTNGEAVCWGSNTRYGATGVVVDSLYNDYYVYVSSHVTTFHKVINNDLTNTLKEVQQVESGYGMSCAIVGVNNEVKCWGRYAYGCNDSIPRTTYSGGNACNIIKEDDSLLNNVKDIAVNDVSACAITNDNKLYCWGFIIDADGQSFNNSYSYSLSETNLHDSNKYRNKAKEILISKTPNSIHSTSRNTCVTFSDTSMSCMGYVESPSYEYPISGATGFHDLTEVIASGVSDEVSMSRYRGCYRDISSNLKCWGKDRSTGYLTGTPYAVFDAETSLELPQGLNDANKISLHETGICVSDSLNKLACWGNNSYFQNGNATTGEQKASEVTLIKESPQGGNLQVNHFVRTPYNSLIITPNIIDNEDWYQNEIKLATGFEGEELIYSLFENPDLNNDAFTILTKPNYGTIESTGVFGEILYTPNRNVTDQPLFDKMTYIKNNDRNNVYTVWFETKKKTNPIYFIDKNFTAANNSSLTIYDTTIATDPDGLGLGFKILNESFLDSNILSSKTCSQDSVVTSHNYYCILYFNGSATGNFPLEIEISDGTNTYTKTYEVYLSSTGIEPVITELVKNYSITPYEKLVVIPSKSFYGSGSETPYFESLSGVVNESGTYKVYDINGIEAGLMDNCSLSNTASANTKCIFTPYADFEGNIEIQYKAKYSSNLSSDTGIINIEVSKLNKDGLPFIVGQTNTTIQTLYQTESYLYRLQGGSDPSIRYGDAYPAPLFDYFVNRDDGTIIAQQRSPNDEFIFPKNIISSDVYLTTRYCFITSDGKSYCNGYGPLSGNYHSISYPSYNTRKIKKYDHTDLTESKKIYTDVKQSCSIVGANNELWCWGDTKSGNLNNSNTAGQYLSSGCGSLDSITRNGMACPIKINETQNLENVKDVAILNNATCAIVDAGIKDEIYCWGYKLDGEGTNLNFNSSENVLNYATKLTVDGNIKFNRINKTYTNSFCASSNLGLYCAGNNPYILGLASGYNNLTPIMLDYDFTSSVNLIKTSLNTNKALFKITGLNESESYNLTISSTNDLNPNYTILSENSLGNGLKELNVELIIKDSIYNISLSSTSLNLNENLILKEIDGTTYESDKEYLSCMYSNDDDFYCLGYIQSTYNFLDNTLSPVTFNNSLPTKIDFLSNIGMKNYKYDIKKYSYCFLNNLDEVECFGSNVYGRLGKESGMSSADHIQTKILFEERNKILQKIDGDSFKAKDFFKTTSNLVLISKGVPEINVDIRPQEFDVLQGESQPALISEVDTTKYEYTIIKQPTYGTLSGSVDNLEYTSNNNYSGTDEMSYRVFDKERDYSVIKTIKFKVSDQDLTPEGRDEVLNLKTNEVIGFYLYKTDPDTSSSNLTCSIVSQPLNHATDSFSCNSDTSDGCYCTINYDIVTTDSLTYQVNDGNSLSEVKTISINSFDNKNPIIKENPISINLSSNQKDSKIKISNSYRINQYERNTGGLYYNLVSGTNSEIDLFDSQKPLIVKDDLGNSILSIKNCFLNFYNTSTSSDLDCDIEILDLNYNGSLELDYEVSDSSNTVDFKSVGKVIFNLNNINNIMYALGNTSTNDKYNLLGDYENYSTYYREKGGLLNNNAVSLSASRETYPVPFLSSEKIFTNINVADSKNNIFCFQTDNTNEVYCINNNGGGSGGVNSINQYIDNRFKNKIQFEDGSLVNNLQQIEVGSIQSCGLNNNSEIICWGGTKTTSNTATYVSPSGCGFQAYLTSVGNACYVVDNNNNKINNAIKIAVDNNTSYNRGCYIDSLNKVHCWGYNFSGTYNDSNIKNYSVAMTEFNDKNAIDLRLEGNSMCVIYNDNTIRCIGDGQYNLFQNGNNSFNTSPVDLVFENDLAETIPVQAETLQLSLNRACILGQDNALYCWGYSSYGEFSTVSDYPTTYKTLNKVTKILDTFPIKDYKLSEYNICTKDNNDHLYCWGYNYYGELGNGKYWNTNSNITYNYFNNNNYIAIDEIEAVKKLTDNTNLKVKDFFMTNQNMYLTVPTDESYIVPYLNHEEIIIDVNENDGINIDLTLNEDPNQYISLLKKYTLYTNTIFNEYSSPDNFVMEIKDNLNDPIELFLTYLFQDYNNQNFVAKKYIFRITPQNDAPIYQNKTVYLNSGNQITVYHNSVDPDGTTTFNYNLVDNVTQGTLDCSTTTYCVYTAPTLSQTDSEIIEIATFSVIDEEGLASESLGSITFVTKPIPNPFFKDQSNISLNMEKGSKYFSFKVPFAIDPEGLSLSYEVQNNTVRSVFDSNLNKTLSKIYDSIDTNKEVGYIEDCFLDVVNGSNSVTNCRIYMTDLNYTGDIVLEYNASNGNSASANKTININVSESINSNKLYYAGISGLSYRQYYSFDRDNYVLADYYKLSPVKLYVQEDFETSYLEYNLKNIDSIINFEFNDSGLCYTKESSNPVYQNLYCTDLASSTSNSKMGIRSSTTNGGSGDFFDTMKFRLMPMKDYKTETILEDEIYQVEIGLYQTCVIKGNEKSTLCWGNTSSIYDRSTSTKNTSGCGFVSSVLETGKSCQLVDQDELPIEGVAKISIGNDIGCLIKDNLGVKNLYCWGYDIDFDGDSSLDGNGLVLNYLNMNNHLSLVDGIGLNEVKDVEVSGTTACAIMLDDSITCWGKYESGLIGLTQPYVYQQSNKYYTTKNFIPKDSVNNNVIPKQGSLVMNDLRACFISTDSKLFCWGFDGNTEPTEINLPTNTNTWEEVQLSNRVVCVKDSINELYCYGNNYYGEAGVALNAGTYNIINPNDAQRVEKESGVPIKVKNFKLEGYHMYIVEE